MRSGREKIRNGFIPCGSTRATFGAPKQIKCLRYQWTPGSPIWSRQTKLLDGAQCAFVPPSRATTSRPIRMHVRILFRATNVFDQMSATGPRTEVEKCPPLVRFIPDNGHSISPIERLIVNRVFGPKRDAFATCADELGGSTLRQALLISLRNSVNRRFHPRRLPRCLSQQPSD
jgi:hypothetical protein